MKTQYFNNFFNKVKLFLNYITLRKSNQPLDVVNKDYKDSLKEEQVVTSSVKIPRTKSSNTLTKEKLDQFLQDRVPSSFTSNKEIEAKQGANPGFNIQRKRLDESKQEYQHTYTLKQIYKDSNRFLNEYIGGALYKRMLYDAAPVIELTHDKDNSFYTQSKWLHKFKTAAEYWLTEEYKENKFKNVTGYEKLIASILFLSEKDDHNNNIGIIEKEVIDKEGNKKVELQFAKIDHDQSFFMDYCPNVYEIAEKLDTKRKKHNHEQVDLLKFKEEVNKINLISAEEMEKIVSHKLNNVKNMGLIAGDFFSLNWTEYNNYLERAQKDKYYYKLDGKIVALGIGMDLEIDEKQNIVCRINSRTDPIIIKEEQLPESSELKANFSTIRNKIANSSRDDYRIFNPKEEEEALLQAISAKKYTLIREDERTNMKKELDFQHLEAAINDRLRERKETFKELAEALDIVIKIEKTGSELEKREWNDHGWIKALKEKDGPIAWAIKNKKQIEEKDPLIWAIENDKVIYHGVRGYKPLQWAIKNKLVNETDFQAKFTVSKPVAKIRDVENQNIRS